MADVVFTDGPSKENLPSDITSSSGGGGPGDSATPPPPQLGSLSLEVDTNGGVRRESRAVEDGPSAREMWFLRVLAGAMFVDASGATMVAPFFPAFSDLFDLRQEKIALLLGVRSVTSIIAALPITHVFAKFGHQRVLTLSFTLAIVACMLLAFPQDWEMLLVALFFQGLCTQTVRSGAGSFATNLLSRKKSRESGSDSAAEGPITGRRRRTPLGGQNPVNLFRPHENFIRVEMDPELEVGPPDVATAAEAMGAVPTARGPVSLVAALGILYCWTSMGGVVGPMVGSALYEYTETWVPFVLVGAACLIFAITFAVFKLPRRDVNTRVGKEVPMYSSAVDLAMSDYDKLRHMSQQEVKRSYRGASGLDALAMSGDSEEAKLDVEAAKAASEVAKAENNENRWTTLRVFHMLLHEPVGRAVLAIGCFQSMAWGVYEVVLPYFLSTHCGYRTAEIGVAFGINNLVYAVVAFFIDEYIKRVGSGGSLLTGTCLIVITFPLMCIRQVSCGASRQYILNALNGLGFATIETPLVALLVEVVSHHNLHDYGLLVSVYQLGYTFGYAIAPFFAALLFTFTISVGVMGAMATIIFTCFLYYVWSRGRQER
eukprot:TRINITY_DN26501_c0_g1_i1.p1 TRINITY_DN26501_c0_g1~~TRINITY_DN26501_c0_g1_i1.p1  ORF type:complete len:601 (+),score=74.57 TRINITY_DN26501_c0_g1_i1:780-2582(+)